MFLLYHKIICCFLGSNLELVNVYIFVSFMSTHNIQVAIGKL